MKSRLSVDPSFGGYFFAGLILAFSFLNAKGQEQEKVTLKLRHIKGSQGFDMGGGVTKFGNYYQLSYYYFFQDKYFIKPTLSYEAGKIGLTKYSEYSLMLNFERCFVKYRDFIFLNGGLAPVIQLQNTSNEVLSQSDTYFPYGISADINLEIFVLSKVALFGSLSEIYCPNDKFGNFRYLLGGGLKINFN